MYEYFLAALSISLTMFSTYVLVRAGLKYRKIESITLYFSFYYLFGCLGLVDMSLWFLEIIDSRIFAFVWFSLGLFTGAVGWLFLTQFMHSEKLRKLVKFYIIFSFTIILISIPLAGIHIVEAEILDTQQAPFWFSLIMKTYVVMGGILMLSLLIISAIKTRSKRTLLFAVCLLVWAFADYLLLNHYMFPLYLILYAIVSSLLLVSLKI